MNTTDVTPLPSRPSREQYQKQAKDLVKAYKAGDAIANRRVRTYHPRQNIPKNTAEAAKVRSGQLLDSATPGFTFALADAQVVIAREYGFESWSTFAKHIQGLTRASSPVATFEAAADAVVSGDVVTLQRLLRENPTLVRARSTRAHRATLLHYLGANGVERYREKSPKNAVAIAELLLKAGADVDAVAEMYGKATTLGLVATSMPPAKARVQIGLMETLLAHGAAIDGPAGTWQPLTAALHNGRPWAAAFLANRGARVGLEAAAGLGRLDLVKSFFNADGRVIEPETRANVDSGLVRACLYGHIHVVEFLLEKGADLHADENVAQTALHCAVIAGDLDLVKMLLKHGAPLEARNVFGGTALGQATWSVIHEPRVQHPAIVEALIRAGAKVDEADYPTGSERVDELLRRHVAKSK